MLSEDIRDYYDDYYVGSENDRKRRLAAIEQISHFDSLVGSKNFSSLIDVGAGQGAFLDIAFKARRAERLVAAEISESGRRAIRKRNLPGLEVVAFDGYNLPFGEKEFEIGVCMHVLEHVEHERAFLKEIKRVSRFAVIEVPLEHTFRINDAIKVGKKFGHINYYTKITFLNELETAGFVVKKSIVVAASMEMERHLYGKIIGTAKGCFRRILIAAAPNVATALMVYNFAVFVDCGN